MRLGSQTASMTNHILSRAVIGQPEPVVGMGCTVLCWTDREPATVIEIGTFRKLLTVTVREDKATRTDNRGMCEEQEWSFTPNERGRVMRFARMPNGSWRELGTSDKGNTVFADGHGLRMGERSKYYDFSF